MLSDPAFRTPLAIALGAVAGALSRYYTTLWFASKLGTGFPYGTLCVNLLGAFIMGSFVTLVRERGGVPPEVSLLVAVGFLGSLTTFSTYALDTANLLNDTASPDTSMRPLLLALLYWAGSAVLGVISLWAGIGLMRRFL
ncbi:MAG TPA: fluoride efflux transporter CrcB [Trichocoleus sp.]